MPPRRGRLADVASNYVLWDNGGRQVGRIYSDVTRVTNGFDLLGNPRFMADGTGRTTSTWDKTT